MAYTIKTTSQYFLVGYTYAIFWWGIFTIYCIGYQLNRIRIYSIRKQRLAGNDNSVVADLPGYGLMNYLEYTVRIPFVTDMISIKTILCVSFFTVQNLLFIFFAPFKLADDIAYYTLPDITYFDRRAAFVGLANFGLVFFLAQRNSILPKLSGMTFEELIPYHRIIARIGVAELFPHFVWRMIKAYRKTYIVKDALFYDTEQTTGVIAMLAYFLMFITSVEYIRRNYFEVFYYSHVIFLLVSIIFSCWHESTCMVFLMPSIILWFSDRVVRSYKSRCIKSTSIQVDAVSTPTENQEGIVRVMFKNKLLGAFRPGQYIFTSIVINGRKTWEYANWHPFTVSEIFHVTPDGDDTGIEERIVNSTGDSSAIVDNKSEKKSVGDSISENDYLNDTANILRKRGNGLSSNNQTETMATVHIKALGQKTKELMNAANSSEKGQGLQIYIDGTYGPHLQYQDYPTLALFATGIGITPALSIIKEVVDKRSMGVCTVTTDHVYLTWAVQNTHEIKPFIDMFRYWTSRSKSAVLPIRLSISIFFTRMHENVPTVIDNLEGFRKSFGSRPQINTEMDRIKDENMKRKVWAHVCGSTLFTRTVINEAVKHKFSIHHETFEF